jgi:hypothetical protein
MNEDLAQRDLFSVVPDDNARIERIFDAAEIAPKIRTAPNRRRGTHRRTRAVGRSNARNDGPRSARSGGHVPDGHPRRSEGTLSCDVLGLRRLAPLAAPDRQGTCPNSPANETATDCHRGAHRRSHDHTPQPQETPSMPGKQAKVAAVDRQHPDRVADGARFPSDQGIRTEDYDCLLHPMPLAIACGVDGARTPFDVRD